MIIVSIISLVKFHSHINFMPFEPQPHQKRLLGTRCGIPARDLSLHRMGELGGLAEETDNPRKNVPKAVFMSICVMLVTYTFFAFSTVVGFKGNERHPDQRGHSLPLGRQGRLRGHPLLRLPRRHDLDAGRADRGHELAGSPDL